MTFVDPLASFNGRPWPPKDRVQVDHLTGCAQTLGGPGPSGSRCDCGRDDYNENLGSYWEGYDAAPSYCPYDCDSCHEECFLGSPCPSHRAGPT
jgi:hypothetical protein